jgi:trimeric autotransporter adhesin
MAANTTGTDNTAVGALSLDANTTGSNNTALGDGALSSSTTASNNTAVGFYALVANTDGANNTAVGFAAGDVITTGVSNTVLGADAAGQLTTGQYNVCVGRTVGINLASGSFNTYIGYLAGTNDSGTTGAIVIGAGNNFYADKGNSTGLINPNNGGVYQGNNSSSWSTVSDRRIKKNIEDNNTGLDAINQIQVKNFEYRTEDEIVDFEHPSSAVVKKEGIQLGVIAQEIEEILPDMVKTESTGVKSVNPDNLTWYLVNAVKELSAKVEELESQIGV